MSDKFQYLRDFMDQAINQLGVSGIDCLVYQDHEEIFRHLSGYQDMENRIPMAQETFYNIYSATKVITAVAGMQLVEQGKLLLTAPLYHYLPEFEHMKVAVGAFATATAKKSIRVQDIFAMTAGISYERDTEAKRQLQEATGGDFSTRDFVRAIAQEPLQFEPGEGWCYSYCHDVLAALIEVVSGQSFGAYLSQHIFQPLGMHNSGFTLPKEKQGSLAPQYEYDPDRQGVTRIPGDCRGAAGLRHESGGGGLIMTPEDYILFADALACNGVGKTGQKIISGRSIALMKQNRLHGRPLEDLRRMGVSEGIGYGLGVATYMDSAAACSLVPEGAFYWGGVGGVQNLFDTQNRLSYFVAQHTYGAPKEHLSPYMLNILYSVIS